MPKFFVKDEQIEGNIITINGNDVNHIINVLRLNSGDLIEVCNSDNSTNYNARILKKDKKYVKCEIENIDKKNTETDIDITLFQGLPKSDKMEYIIQKNVEIGVKKIVPVQMDRCIVKLDEKLSKKKIERWNKISEVAAKQSGRNIIPEIDDVIDIKKVCEYIKKYDIVLVAYENEKNNTLKSELKKIEKNKNIKIAIVIGPEGGIDQGEIAKMIENGAKLITLGDRILRTETASIVMASNIIYEMEM